MSRGKRLVQEALLLISKENNGENDVGDDMPDIPTNEREDNVINTSAHASGDDYAEPGQDAVSESASDPYGDSGDSYHPSEEDSDDLSSDDRASNENINFETRGDADATGQNMGPTRSITKRKRRDESNWKRNVIKTKRNRGDEYVTYKGKTIAAKTFSPVLCNCRRKCSEILTPEIQNNIHSQFYALDWNGQTAWICTTIKISAPKRPKKRRNNVPSHKQHSRSFILKNIQVCKSFFLKVLQISNKRLDYALNKKRDPDTGMPLPDKRGKGPSGNKIKVEVVDFIKNHIESFPRYTSHYGERTSSRQYLAPGLNLLKLLKFANYREKCQEHGKNPAKRSFYESIFRSYKLHFYIPKNDTCKTCDVFNVKIQNETNVDNELEIKQQQKNHHLLAAKARDLLNRYKQNSLLKHSASCLITFDLQRTLPTPMIQTGEVYYLRQLQTLNFGTHLHSPAGEIITMNMWYETTGGRGSQEILSCLYNNIKNAVPEDVNTLYTFSDSCTGQNRNWIMFHFMMYIVNSVPNLSEIIVCYLVSGHSFLPNDSDFSDITKSQKKKEFIYIPEQWMTLVEKCRKKGRTL